VPANHPSGTQKAPFFRLPEPKIRPSDPSFPAQSPRKSPILRTFPRPLFRTTCPYSSPSSLVTRHSLVASHQPFRQWQDHSMTQSPDHSILSAPVLPSPRGEGARRRRAGEGSFPACRVRGWYGCGLCPVTQLPFSEVATLPVFSWKSRKLLPGNASPAFWTCGSSSSSYGKSASISSSAPSREKPAKHLVGPG